MTRTEHIKEYILDNKPEICMERGRIYTEEFFRDGVTPLVVRRARAFARYLDEMTIYIGPYDLLVGNTANKPLAAGLFPEYAVNWIHDELDTFAKRDRQRFLVPEGMREEILAMCEKWEGQTHFDRVDYNLRTTIGDYLMGYDHPSVNQTMIIEHNQNGDGHIIPDYIGLLDTGLKAQLDNAKQNLALLAEEDEEYFDKKAFLESVIICLEACMRHAKRLSDLAAQMAMKEEDETRRKELVRIAKTCAKVPENRPDTFEEAMQFVLLIHLWIQIESNGHSISMGRMDSYLYPYYEADCKAGILDEAKAQQLCECFLLKCFEANKLRDWGTTENLGGNQLFQTITLGGQTPQGKTAVNPLSYIFLEALGNTNMNIPTVIVSCGRTTPIEFYEAALRALVRHGGGMPAFFNDDVSVEMMMRDGINIRDARSWAGMGCSEVRIPGKHGTGVTPVYVNVMKLLELALHDGFNPETGKTLHPSSRPFTECKNLDEVIALWEEQLDYYLPFVSKIERAIAESYFTLTPTPFLSSVVNYRIEMAKDISWGRGPNYNNTIVHAHGYPNAANALAALDYVVFKNKQYTLAEVMEAIDHNYEGDEKYTQIRHALLSAPKFGNDDDYVDGICKRIFEIIPHKMDQFRPLRGGHFGCTAQTVVMNVTDGAMVGATPDGRKAHEYLADNISPTTGTDLEGITAVFNSLSKLDHALMDNGSILNIRFHPTAVDNDEKRRKVAQAIAVYFDMGGFQVQFNVVSSKTLRDAQEHPDKYRSMVVKVAGFSCFYVELEKRWQDHLIARTEYDAYA